MHNGIDSNKYRYCVYYLIQIAIIAQNYASYHFATR